MVSRNSTAAPARRFSVRIDVGVELPGLARGEVAALVGAYTGSIVNYPISWTIGPRTRVETLAG
jgi:hypothetical protein